MRLLILLCLIVVYAQCKNLQFVQAIFRHGDRAPTKYPYPTDRYVETYWPRGWGGLTNIGMGQLVNLGKFFRDRYTNFTSDIYKEGETYMRASDVDRALESAQGFLHGFYPATGSQQFENGFNWQPVPVHSVLEDYDDLICVPTHLTCPNHDAKYAAVFNNLTAYYDNKYADMFAYIGPKMGVQNFTYADTYKVYDINREIANNMLDQPEWVYKNWEQYDNRTTLDICTELREVGFVAGYAPPEMGQYFGGYLLNNFIETAFNASQGKQTKPTKMRWYSSHDTVVSALMNTMRIGDNLIPPYSACLFMEVYSDPATVEFYYRNDPTKDPTPITLPGCEFSCPVEKFASIYKDVVLTTPEAVRQNCGAPAVCPSGNGIGSSLVHTTLLLMLLSLFIRY